MDRTKIICVVGATASGKTGLGVAIAKAIGGEVISADSMQVYKGMPIATAAATADEKQGIPHHLVECLEPEHSFSVADFVRCAGELIDGITRRGNVPVIVGGTGLFVDSLVRNIQFADVGEDNTLRKELEQLSTDELYSRLCRVDPEAAHDIHPNNKKRVIRGLELYYSGTSKTQQNMHSCINPSPYDALYIGIGYDDRQKLYDRINLRVDRMLDAGILEEAEAMRSKTSATSSQAIGHKELYPYLDGEISLEQAVDNLKKGTRHYAKRQLTWFRRNENIHWLYADRMSEQELIDTAVELCRQHIG